jgi:predicted phosphate transport protein (TIGR00153 family)
MHFLAVNRIKGAQMLKLFKTRRNIFIEHIHRQASLTLEGMDLLIAYLNKPEKKLADRLTAKEKEADEVRRILIDELNRTFITPFDREDLFALSRAIDDVMDYAYSTVVEIEVFKTKPTDYMMQICTLLRDASFEILQAVECLQHHPAVASDHAQRAKKMENQVESIYREALADMFKRADSVKTVVKAMKLREVYRHLSNAADRGDEAANVLSDIIMKTS